MQAQTNAADFCDTFTKQCDEAKVQNDETAHMTRDQNLRVVNIYTGCVNTYIS